MRKIIFLFIVIMALPIQCLFAQVEVTPTFRFNDGIYLSLEEFQKNQPSLKWSNFDRQLVTNPQTLITQVEYIRYKNSQESLDLNKIWGISMDGLPFIRIPKDSIHKELYTFAGLRLAGNICYFSYENRIEKDYDFAAYNPLTKQPFRRATVSRTLTVFKEKIFQFELGSWADFNKSTLTALIQDDPQLLGTLNSIDSKDQEFQEKLFRLLISYNRRHPVYFK